MRTLTLDLPTLHRSQHEVCDNLGRFSVLCAGRRYGKTRLGTLLCIAKAAERKHCWWVGPNYPTASVGWRMLRQLAMQIPGAEIREADKRITLPTGGWVQVRSADAPESLRGEGLDFVVIDEVAHIAKFGEAWEQALRPALSDRQGGALFISTPKGYNHFYELWQKGEAEGWARWQMPSWANPFLAQSEIDAAKRDLPALVFRQEYGAEFVQIAGAVFKREYFNVIDTAPAVRYVRSWDLAISTKTSGDYTVGAKVALVDGRLVIADIVRGRWEWPDVVWVIAQTAHSDGAGVVQGIECVGTQAGMLQTLQREPALADIAFRAVLVHADKLTRCLPWLARAEQGLVDLVRGAWNAAFLDEACAFPETIHDDQVDAVSGAVASLGRSTIVARSYQG